MNRRANTAVGLASAYVACHRDIDVGVSRLWVCHEQGCGTHDLASLTVTALRHVEIDPGLLQGM
jgi:hypothetical protein